MSATTLPKQHFDRFLRYSRLYRQLAYAMWLTVSIAFTMAHYVLRRRYLRCTRYTLSQNDYVMFTFFRGGFPVIRSRHPVVGGMSLLT